MEPAAPLPFLDTLSEWGSFQPGLGRVRTVLEALDHPERSFRHLLVGGTNGKGTVSATLAREWARGGIGEVGLFLSPHLMDVRERITVRDGDGRGRWLPDETWREAHEHIRKAAPDADLSYFEWLFLLAVVHFAERGVAAAVFEVGVGGREDATNTLDPELSVVTNVDLEHTAVLGTTIEEIALHKVGIARPGCPLVLPESLLHRPPVAAVVRETEAIPVTFPDADDDRGGDPFQHGRRAVHAALFLLGLDPTGLRLELLPGRREVVKPVGTAGAGVYLDGAHNLPAWRGTVRWLKEIHGPEPLCVLANLSRGREPQQFLGALAPIAREFVVWDDPDGSHEQELPTADWPPRLRRVASVDLPTLLEEPLLVCGSLYTVGRFRRWLVDIGMELPA